MGFEDMGASAERLGVVLVAGAAAYVAVIVFTRLAGPRSLAKMSSYDFAATVAVGSTLSSTVLGSVPLAAGVAGLALLFLLQFLIAAARRRGLFAGLVDNSPLLLMAHGEVLDDNLRHARLSRDELWASLRKAGVTHLAEVHAAVLETAGEISVLRADRTLDRELVDGVRGAQHLTGRPGS